MSIKIIYSDNQNSYIDDIDFNNIEELADRLYFRYNHDNLSIADIIINNEYAIPEFKKVTKLNEVIKKHAFTDVIKFLTNLEFNLYPKSLIRDYVSKLKHLESKLKYIEM